jgi:hypothetical protein
MKRYITLKSVSCTLMRAYSSALKGSLSALMSFLGCFWRRAVHFRFDRNRKQKQEVSHTDRTDLRARPGSTRPYTPSSDFKLPRYRYFSSRDQPDCPRFQDLTTNHANIKSTLPFRPEQAGIEQCGEFFFWSTSTRRIQYPKIGLHRLFL